jgi:hypothetical protein
MFDDEVLWKIVNRTITDEQYYELQAEMVFQNLLKELMEDEKLLRLLREEGRAYVYYTRIAGMKMYMLRINDTPVGRLFRKKLEEYNAKPEGRFLLGITKGKDERIMVQVKDWKKE